MEEDYNSFFATQQVESVNNRGEKVYVKNPDGTNKRDDHGHFIVDHDLFNHEGKTDILINVDGKNLFIGECKFWTGEKGYLETLDQVLSYLS